MEFSRLGQGHPVGDSAKGITARSGVNPFSTTAVGYRDTVFCDRDQNKSMS